MKDYGKWIKRLSSILRYDPESGKLYWTKSQGRAAAGDEAGSVVGNYREICFQGSKAMMHRVIWYMHYDEILPSGVFLDHINRIPLDNRISNLRKSTCGQNIMNRPGLSGAASKYKGVRYMKAGLKHWHSEFKKDGKCTFLGVFQTEEEAALAYDKAVSAAWGEFAYQNFPSEALR